ncbi:MAG: type II toxin-antitoxin system RelE/ParE family toxin [Spirosomataceae bacterium]
MIYPVIWTNAALDDLLAIEEFLGEGALAEKVIDNLIARAEQIQLFPLSGTQMVTSQNREYRFLVEGNYKIIYSFRAEKVSIHAIFDTRQDPNKLKI